MSAEIEITNAVAIERDYLYMSGSLDSMQAYSAHTRLSVYDERGSHLWSKHDVEWWTSGVAIYLENKEAEWELCAMSNEGEIEFMGDHDPTLEKISGAGVYSADAKGWGYMRTIRQIGDHLYAVGGAGQVYKRLGPNHWEHMDDGVLQAPDVDNRLLLADINGSAENDLYICGGIPGAYGLEGRLYHWDGKQWASVTLPTTERLTAIYVEDQATVWIAGVNGTLLQGNWQSGFKDHGGVDDNQLFYSLTKFNSQIYLASNLGLFVYDGNKISEVQTGLTPELQDAGVVDAIDGVLWSVGPKDIAKFDGVTWTRIDHPDNPPIR